MGGWTEREEGGIEVRWGLPGDEVWIAELLELNGMPRPLAFEERFIVAEEGGEVLAALGYRTESKRLVLGLLVVDPWVEERPLARALYAGAHALAWEMGVREILVLDVPYGGYPRGVVGYHRRGRLWRLDVARSRESFGELPEGGWRRVFALLGLVAVPFHRGFRS